jgi:transcription termination/antitermination protein NusG
MQDRNSHKWYIVNVMAGQENKVAADIKSMIVRSSLADNIKEVLVPTKSVVKIKKGQKVQESQKLFPGYIFVNTDLSGEVYSLINSIPKVMGFLGAKGNPQEIADIKMQEILSLSSLQNSDSKNAIFEIGETLNVIEGPFESFSGVVEDFDSEKQKVKISILIFGRATSVELDVNQVEKVS